MTLFEAFTWICLENPHGSKKGDPVHWWNLWMKAFQQLAISLQNGSGRGTVSLLGWPSRKNFAVQRKPYRSREPSQTWSPFPMRVVLEKRNFEEENQKRYTFTPASVPSKKAGSATLVHPASVAKKGQCGASSKAPARLLRGRHAPAPFWKGKSEERIGNGSIQEHSTEWDIHPEFRGILVHQINDLSNQNTALICGQVKWWDFTPVIHRKSHTNLGWSDQLPYNLGRCKSS